MLIWHFSCIWLVYEVPIFCGLVWFWWLFSSNRIFIHQFYFHIGFSGLILKHLVLLVNRKIWIPSNLYSIKGSLRILTFSLWIAWPIQTSSPYHLGYKFFFNWGVIFDKHQVQMKNRFNLVKISICKSLIGTYLFKLS